MFNHTFILKEFILHANMDGKQIILVTPRSLCFIKSIVYTFIKKRKEEYSKNVEFHSSSKWKPDITVGEILSCVTVRFKKWSSVVGKSFCNGRAPLYYLKREWIIFPSICQWGKGSVWQNMIKLSIFTSK